MVDSLGTDRGSGPTGAATMVDGGRTAAQRANGSPLIELTDVSFSYANGFRAVNDLTLSIPRGKVTAIVGPSGCGKTTVLKMIGGLDTPTTGTLETHFDDAEAGSHPITMVFQQDTLLPWLRVRENVALYYRFHPKRESKASVRARVEELLASVGLARFADAYPSQLSGGMRRRVAFLAGVVAQPQLLLLDEPFSSVDEPSRIQIHQQVADTIERLGMTVVLVTHDLAEAISLADQVVILTGGPGRVAHVHEIDLGERREMLALRDTPQYLAAYGRLWKDLSHQITIATAQPGASDDSEAKESR